MLRDKEKCSNDETHPSKTSPNSSVSPSSWNIEKNTSGEATKSPKTKPALLPKPQVLPSDLRFTKHVQAQARIKHHTSSQTLTASTAKTYFPETSLVLPKKSSKVRPAPGISPQSVFSPESKVCTPPKLLPKPQLPAKTVIKSKSAIITGFREGISPIRPPRSPKKVLRTNPLDALLASPPIPDSALPTSSWIVHKQKSASLARNENFSSTIRELVKVGPNEITYYQGSSSTEETPVPRPRARNKPKLRLNLELDLATSDSSTAPHSAPIYATVDYSRKKNRRLLIVEDMDTPIKPEDYYSTNESFETRRSSDSNDSFKSLVDMHESVSKLQEESVSELQVESVSELQEESAHELNEKSASELHEESAHELNEKSASELHEESAHELNEKSASELHEESVRELNEESASELHEESAHELNEESASELSEGASCNGRLSENVMTNSQLIVENYEQVFKKTTTSVNYETVSPKSKEQPITSTPSIVHTPAQYSDSLVSDTDCSPWVQITSNLDTSQDTVSDQSLQALLSPDSRDTSPGIQGDSLSRVGSSGSESSGAGRWFWGIGQKRKQEKKDKKERCASQFYTSNTAAHKQFDQEGYDELISQQPRAVSLPDMKHTDTSNTETDAELLAERAESCSLGHHSDSDEDKHSLLQLEMGCDVGQDKPYLIAKEIASSEAVFIDVLRLLNVHFRNYIEFKNNEFRSKVIPDADIHKILNFLPELQSLNEDILQDFNLRIQHWAENPKIADVIVKKGAFLKMYTSYIQNFESQTKYLDECIARYPRFAKAVEEFEASDRCRKLTLKHYMLKPVQRIPQYRLLLGEYEKKIVETSPDFEDTEKALKIVCDVAEHANRSIKFGDKNGRMMHFQSLLSDFELIKPGRELIKDGSLEKICRKTVKERFFVLLNDCLLHTTYSKNYLKIHQSLPLSGMKVYLVEEEKHPFTFTILNVTKSFILCAKSETERMDWVRALEGTIDAHISRQKTFMKGISVDSPGSKLGKKAPVWIPDNKVTMCQICTAEFTALFRRHHCRACGKVICKFCGNNQAPIQYRGFKPDRVCEQCFFLLLRDYEESEVNICQVLKEIKKLTNEEELRNEYLNIKTKFVKSSSSNSWKKRKYIPPRLIEVSANTADSVMRGWLHRKSRKTWKMLWYVLKEHVLYVYRASEDVVALDTLPVLGYNVIRPETDFEEVDKNLVFILNHKQQPPLVFHADVADVAERWACCLNTASKFTELG